MARRVNKVDVPLWKVQGYDDAVARVQVTGEVARRVLVILRRIQDLNDIAVIHALTSEAISILTSQWKVEQSMDHLRRVIEEVLALSDRLEAMVPGSISGDPDITNLLNEMRVELERERSQAESVGH